MLQQSLSTIAVTKASKKLQRLRRPVPLPQLHIVLVTSSGFVFVPTLLKPMGVLSFGRWRNGKDNLCIAGRDSFHFQKKWFEWNHLCFCWPGFWLLVWLRRVDSSVIYWNCVTYCTSGRWELPSWRWMVVVVCSEAISHHGCRDCPSTWTLNADLCDFGCAAHSQSDEKTLTLACH